MTTTEHPRYELFYWPHIPGRGEFIRLMFEDAGVAYVDVVRRPVAEGGGIERMLQEVLGAADDAGLGGVVPFAPPVLRAGDRWLSQTARICDYLGPRLGLAPADELDRGDVLQLLLTVLDFVSEAHDVHHPLGPMLRYEEQRDESLRAAKAFFEHRVPKFFRYFERLLERNRASDHRALVGADVSYADLALFHTLEGLAYAFPRSHARVASTFPRLQALRENIRVRPRLAAYLASPRRVPFGDGLFRHYPELDVGAEGG